MQKKPNYDFERKERDRAKAAKKAEKLAAKTEAKERQNDPNVATRSDDPTAT